MLTKIQGPMEPAVSLDYAKKFIRVSTTADDELLTTLLRAAEQRLDGRDGILGRCLMAQTWRYDVPSWSGMPIYIPLPPLIQVTGITYLDSVGASQVLDPALYRVVGAGSARASLVAEIGVSVPTMAAGQADGFSITFDAGYQSDSSPENIAVLETIRQAIVLMAKSWYDMPNQEDIPEVVNSLIAPHKVDRLGRY